MLKNKLGETKPWASSLTAKAMQAQFLCLAHNLLQLFERVLAREHQLHPTAKKNRRAKRLASQLTQTRQAGAQLSPLFTGLLRLIQ